MKRLLILGAGGYGRTIADMASQMGEYDQISFLDDNSSAENILGTCEDVFRFPDDQTAVYPAFGSGELRMKWLRRLEEAGFRVPALIHPSAYVSPTAVIGTGTMVLPMAVVNTGVTVMEGCILNIGTLVDHDCVIEAGCHLAPGAIVKAENRIPSGMKVESGTVIENRHYPL
jgi:UDP-N-acetylbacillosamine N-acetyltransferase